MDGRINRIQQMLNKNTAALQAVAKKKSQRALSSCRRHDSLFMPHEIALEFG
jgi:hypothetical protein